MFGWLTNLQTNVGTRLWIVNSGDFAGIECTEVNHGALVDVLFAAKSSG